MSDQILVIDSTNKDNWKNCGGTSRRPNCACGSWKEHWENFSGKTWPSECSKKGCTKTPEVGAHVESIGVSGEWIAPLCKTCNAISGERFSLNTGTVLVSANKSRTCE